MQELELLQQKLDQLLKRFANLQSEKERLDKTVLQQSGLIQEQKDKIATLEAEIKLKAVALSAHHSDIDKENLKLQLDKVIREIEKNIEML